MIAHAHASPPVQRAHRFKHNPRQLKRELSLTAVELRRRCCHRELGFSSLRDYVRARSGITWNTWSSFVRAGTVLAASPRASNHYQQGTLAFSVVERMASQCEPSRWDALADELQSLPTSAAFARLKQERKRRPPPNATIPGPGPSSDPSDELVRVSISMPASVAAYVEETLELAGYLLGDDSTPDQGMEAACAEAASEVLASVEPEEARERFRRSARTVAHRRAGLSSLATPPSPPADSAPVTPVHDAPPTARELDQRFTCLLQKYAQLETQREDELLSMFHDNAHGQCGFPNFERFAEQCLDLPSSNAHEMLRRAREHRAGHPLALARFAGEITAFQFETLHRLERHAGVPRSRLCSWITEARSITTRLLTAKVEWAIRTSRNHYLRWSTIDFAPPSDDELRASIQSPTTIASDPSLPDFSLPAEDLFAESELPPLDLVTLNWTLSRETADALFQLMASIADHACAVAHRRTGIPLADLPQPPSWWSLLKVMHIARVAWTQHVQPEYHRRWHRATLERDRYRCRAPECTKRSTLEVHHIIYAGNGGPDEEWNLVTLCHYHHHHGQHAGRIRVRGIASDDGSNLRWRMGVMGEYVGDRRQLAQVAPVDQLEEQRDPARAGLQPGGAILDPVGSP